MSAAVAMELEVLVVMPQYVLNLLARAASPGGQESPDTRVTDTASIDPASENIQKKERGITTSAARAVDLTVQKRKPRKLQRKRTWR